MESNSTPDTTDGDREEHRALQEDINLNLDTIRNEEEEEEEDSHSSQLINVAVVVADEQDAYDDVETGTLPVIELPTASSTASSTSTTAGGYVNDNIELLTAGVVEAPNTSDGAMTLEDLEAAPIAHLVKDDCCGGTMTVADDSDCDGVPSETSSTLPVMERRAEFISATIHKPPTDDKDTTTNRSQQSHTLGMDLISDDKGEVFIASIAPGSLMANTPFQVGDRLLSVNSKRCYIMDAKDVVQFMATLEGNVTIVVHNEGGDPNLVESMITKPSLDHRCGLGLASTGRQHLKISNIDADGLFFDTLLNVGDPVVSINGEMCEVCDAQDAGEIIARAGIFITIKARTLLETGVVVAAFSCNNSTGSNIPPEIVNAFHPHDNTPSVKQLVSLTAVAVILICLLLATGLLQ